MSSVFNLAWYEGIYNRPTKGTRWQQSGFFAIMNGKVKFAKAAETANEIPNMGAIAESMVR